MWHFGEAKGKGEEESHDVLRTTQARTGNVPLSRVRNNAVGRDSFRSRSYRRRGFRVYILDEEELLQLPLNSNRTRSQMSP